MSVNKRFIEWTVEELETWMILVSKDIEFMTTDGDGKTFKKKETYEVGRFRSKRGGETIDKAGKQVKVGYTGLMQEKLGDLLGGDRGLHCQQPFEICGTNKEKATMKSYWRCGHKESNSIAISCLWSLFRPGKVLRFHVGEHNCKPCILQAAEIVLYDKDSTVNQQTFDSSTVKRTLEKEKILPSSLESTLTSVLMEEKSEEETVQGNQSHMNTSETMALEIYSGIKYEVNQVIDDWYMAMPSRVGTGQSVNRMMSTIHTLGFNGNRAIVNCGEQLKLKYFKPIQDMSNEVLQTQQKFHVSTTKPTKFQSNLASSSQTKVEGFNSKLLTVDLENLPQCLRNIIEPLEENVKSLKEKPVEVANNGPALDNKFNNVSENMLDDTAGDNQDSGKIDETPNLVELGNQDEKENLTQLDDKNEEKLADIPTTIKITKKKQEKKRLSDIQDLIETKRKRNNVNYYMK